jgi:hypothetical protein
VIDSWFRFLGPDLGGVLGDEEAWVAATLPPSSGGGDSGFSGTGFCVLCVLCAICGEE